MLKSKTLIALAMAGALGGWTTAQADTQEGYLLVCDQDPAQAAAASCVLMAPSPVFESMDSQAEAASEPRFVTYSLVDAHPDLSATGGFEWVLDAPLVS